MKSFPAWLKWLLPPVLLAALCLYAAWLFLPKGSGVGAVLAALAHPSAADLSLDQRVVLAVRLPRILTALLVGAVMAVSGLLLQTMTRNPLASPSLLSINAGGYPGGGWQMVCRFGFRFTYTLSAQVYVSGDRQWDKFRLAMFGRRRCLDVKSLTPLPSPPPLRASPCRGGGSPAGIRAAADGFWFPVYIHIERSGVCKWLSVKHRACRQ